MAGVQEGTWTSKVLVRDKTENKSFILNVDAKAQWQKKLRLDITSPISGHVASLYMNDKQVKYLLVPQKKFYVGMASDQILRPVLMVPLNPSWLYNIFFDRAIEGKDWTCTQDKQGRVEQCKNLAQKITITWKDRAGERKTVLLDHSLGSLQMNFVTFAAKVSDPDKAFQLDAPKNFERLKVQ